MAIDSSERTLARLKAVRELFDTAGWKELQREIKEEYAATEQDALRASTWEETLFLRGKLNKLDWFSSIQTITENEIDLIEAEEVTFADV